MASSDTGDDVADDIEFEKSSEVDAEDDQEIDDELLDALEGEPASDASEEDDSDTEESGDGSDDDDDDDDEDSEPPVSAEATMDIDSATQTQETIPEQPTSSVPQTDTSQRKSETTTPVHEVRRRSLSPAHIRRKGILASFPPHPRSYQVEAICAIPHPAPTHALASSMCMTHLLTGSDDGYIRDYDVFAAVNGKNFLTAPQRQHSGVVEGIMKAGQLRSWWENKGLKMAYEPYGEPHLSPVYSLAAQSDALWALAGSRDGHINLFTVRQEPGRWCHAMNGHGLGEKNNVMGGAVSSLALEHDEKGFFSAGWDGETQQWDLNTGQVVRKFTAHDTHLAGVAVRPISTSFSGLSPMSVDSSHDQLHANQTVRSSGSEEGVGTGNSLAITGPTGPDTQNDAGAASAANESPMLSNFNKGNTLSSLPPGNEMDAKSDASFDPLFDDEPDGDVSQFSARDANMPERPESSGKPPPSQAASRGAGIAPPRNAPPLLEPRQYTTFSPDVLMTVYVDGQIILWDKRVQAAGQGVGRLWMSEKTPPWCLSACWSADGGQIYAGRRNGTIDIYDTRQLGRSGPSNTPRLLKTLRNPLSSGVVSCVVAFPDGRHIASASNDNIRLWNAAEAGEPDGSGKMKSGVQFKIIPGHHGGFISQMIVDPGARFLVSASSGRGWHDLPGDSSRTVFVHDIKHVQ